MMNAFIIQSKNFYYFTTKNIGEGSINWSALALTRFLLSFIVVTTHTISCVDDPGPLKWINYFGAFNAIIGFLLISGLSIGKSILKDKEGYFLRRAQRIYPVYIASIGLVYLISPSYISIDLIFTVIVNVLFLNQLVTDTSYVGPAWTLALEVWLYCLAPLFLRLSYKSLLIITSLSFFSYCLYTCGRSLFDYPYYSGLGYGLNILFLSFIWIAGFMLAIFPNKSKQISFFICLIFFIYFSLTSAISVVYRIKHKQINLIFTKDIISFIFEAICLIFICYIVVSNRKLPKISLYNKKIFNFLGNISYPLYLTHASILKLCEKLHISNWLILVLLCLGTASLIYWLLDFYSKKRIA